MIRSCVLVVIAIGLLPAAAASAAPGAALSKKSLRSISLITDAYFRGDARSAVHILSPLLGKLTDERLEQFDHALSEQGLPPLANILSDARLAMAQQGFGGDLPKLHIRELLLILPVLEQQVTETLANETLPEAAPPPAGAGALEHYETLLWNMHVRVNRVMAGKRLAEYTAGLAASVPQRQTARLDQRQREILAHDFAHDVARFDQALADLAEQEIELRLARLSLAKAVLEEGGLTKDRFHAAYAWQRDANQLQMALEAKKRQQQPFQRAALNAADLAQRVTAESSRCRELAGDLTLKATWLFEGLHWWLRGRYGAGPDVWGLAKTQLALQSPQAMFPLLMPAVLPKPTDPTTAAAKVKAAAGARPAHTYYERRHHNWWAWEDRRVQSSTSTKTQSQSFQDWCQKGYFW